MIENLKNYSTKSNIKEIPRDITGIPREWGKTREFPVKIVEEVPREQGMKKGIPLKFPNFRKIRALPSKSRDPVPREYATKFKKDIERSLGSTIIKILCYSVDVRFRGENSH